MKNKGNNMTFENKSTLEQIFCNIVRSYICEANESRQRWESTKTSLTTKLVHIDNASLWYLGCLFVLCFALILLAVQFNKLHHSYDVKELLKKHAYEVHYTAGNLDTTYESVKRCVSLLNQFPSLVNHPMPPYNYTPFLRACWSGNMPLVQYMLKNGADIYSCTITKESPVFLAAYRVVKRHQWDPSVLNLLYAAGCKLSSLTIQGNSALHLAAQAGHVTLAHWLLDRGAHRSLHRTPTSPYEVALKIGGEGHMCIAALLHVFCPEMVFRDVRKARAKRIKSQQ